MINKISLDEKDMIDYWRKAYCEDEECGELVTETFCDLNTLLTPWGRAKSHYLNNLFDGKLILEKEVCYEKSKVELEEEISELIHSWNESASTEFCKRFRNYIFEHFDDYDMWSIKNSLLSLVGQCALASNTYQGETFSITLPNGKKMTIQEGSKTIKIVGKLAKAFEIEGFEEFRIAHSQILNQKQLKGTLCLSIHPLDYMTMSDNECGWDSCMSWSQFGSYRQGTVEMMNSENVIVAYLKSKEDMHICNDNYWNNKKWRELFIVTNPVITEIKAYPYHNPALTEIVMDWLKELAYFNLHWTYEDAVRRNYREEIQMEGLGTSGDKFSLYFETGSMYRDFGSDRGHLMSFGKNLSIEDLEKYPYKEDANRLYVCYSGLGQCMVCGRTSQYADFYNDASLACDCCYSYRLCACCGEPLRGDDYFVNGECYCQDCYYDHAIECEECGCPVHEDEAVRLIGMYRIPNERQAMLNRECRDIAKVEFGTYTPYEEKYREYTLGFYYNESHYFDCQHCLKDWAEKNLREGCKIKFRQIGPVGSSYYTYYFDELKPEALNNIDCCWSEDDNYIESLSDNELIRISLATRVFDRN